MAHTEITERNYDSILDDIKPIIKSADFAFANFESPINDALPQSSYPIFNCHTKYADKIISYGFNIFSLANNHTNDLNLEGIKSTKKYFDSKRTDGIFSTGIKENANDPINFCEIEKNNIKILFAAISEVHNSSIYLEHIDYIGTSKTDREKLIKQIKNAKQNSNCDLLIISFHTAEPEYVTSIAENYKKFYYSLIDSGVDILWINHPHVSKEWEILHTEDNRKQIIFYSVGNTVSAQRRHVDFLKPNFSKAATGDSFLFNVKIKRTENGIQIENPNPILITSYITKENTFVVKKLDDNLIFELEDEGEYNWAEFLSARKNIMNKIEGKDTWQ